MAPDAKKLPHVALAVSGSVAIHRALDLVRELERADVTTTVLMTAAACQLVRPVLFQALSRRRVQHDLWVDQGDDPYGHLGPAREADVMVFAPASADLIARLAAGLGDDMVTTTALAFQGPRVLAPAMNWRMWAHPFTRRNVGTLTDAGYRLVGPAEGDLACGEEGPGRLAEVEDILAATLDALKKP